MLTSAALKLIAGLLVLVVITEGIFLIVNGNKLKKIETIAALNQSQIDQRVADYQSQIDTKNVDIVAQKVAATLEEPYTSRTVDDAYGAFKFQFPHFWYYYEKQSSATNILSIWIDPNLIVDRSATNPVCGTVCATIHIELWNQKYSQTLKSVEDENNGRKSNLKLSENDATVSGIAGKRFSGKWPKKETDEPATFVLLPYRDKSLYLIDDKKDTKLADGMTHEAAFNKFLDALILNK